MSRIRRINFPGGIKIADGRPIGPGVKTPSLSRHLMEEKRMESAVPRERRRKESGEMEAGYRSTDRYLIIWQLGQGGMATVYRAIDTLTQERVAVKRLARCYKTESVFRKRFRKEADIGRRLDHPSITRVMNAVEESMQGPFMVMEEVDGFSLGKRLQYGPLSVERAVEIALQLCEGLAAAHAAGIVHRDVKPDNILVSTESLEHGRIKIIDFGIAKDMHGEQIDQEGVAVGTPGYIPPEQILCQPDMDHRADVYAVGVVLFEMLTGRAPFESESLVEILYLHCTATPPRLRDVRRDMEIPTGLETIVQTALEKRMGDRFPNMEQMRNELRGYL